MRWLLAILAVVLAAQVGWRRIRSEFVTPVAPASVSVPEEGERIPQAVVFKRTRVSKLSDEGVRGSIDDVFQEGCRVAIFFASNCPYCEAMAPRWAGRTKVEVDGDSVEVVWVSVSPADTGAAAFMERWSLPTDWYVLESRAERHRLGILSVPTLFLIRDGILLESGLPRNPEALADTTFTCNPQTLPHS